MACVLRVDACSLTSLVHTMKGCQGVISLLTRTGCSRTTKSRERSSKEQPPPSSSTLSYLGRRFMLKNWITKTGRVRSLEVPSTPVRQLEERVNRDTWLRSDPHGEQAREQHRRVNRGQGALNHVLSGEYEVIQSYGRTRSGERCNPPLSGFGTVSPSMRQSSRTPDTFSDRKSAGKLGLKKPCMLNMPPPGLDPKTTWPRVWVAPYYSDVVRATPGRPSKEEGRTSWRGVWGEPLRTWVLRSVVGGARSAARSGSTLRDKNPN